MRIEKYNEKSNFTNLPTISYHQHQKNSVFEVPMLIHQQKFHTTQVFLLEIKIKIYKILNFNLINKQICL